MGRIEVSQMSFLEQALHLASQGFYVFPLMPKSKLPAIEDYPNRATRDPETIKKFWMDAVLGVEQPFNVGISTTKYNGSQALVAVDIDDKGKKKGSDEVLKLELQGFDFIETLTQKTPSGGRHLIYRAKTAVKQGTNVLAQGVDIRSKGGYIVAPGSVLDSGQYVFENDLPVAECPEWIIEQCGRAIEKSKDKAPDNINQERAVTRAKAYLAKAPVSTEGDGGDQTAYKVAAAVKDFGVDEETCANLMLDDWNERCVPPWSADDIYSKVRNAYSYGVNPVGAKAPEKDFSPIKEMDSKNFLQKLNEEYAVIFIGDKHYILFETVNESGQITHEFLAEYSFKRKFSPYVVQQGKGQAKTYAELWLDWPGRRQYAGICFKPEQKANNGFYNVWRGFTCKPVEYAKASPKARMGFDLFIDHAKRNVTGGDEKLFNWLMGYFAHMIQRPYERPLTTLVFRGSKGVGKNALIDRVGNLLGHSHYLVAHDGRYLTSNFNGHMDSCLCLVLDEAFWSGDKHAEGKLKGLTTSPDIIIERKGKEPYSVKNHVRMIVVGNEDWLVSASSDERRYAVLDVGEGNKQDGKYFHEMRTLIDEHGGNEVLLHYFKNFDLSKIDVNVAPKTAGLFDQKIASLTPIEQFWHQCLMEGEIVHSGVVIDWSRAFQFSKAAFRRALKAYYQERSIRSWFPSDQVVGRELRKLTPSLQTSRVVVDGKAGISENVYRFKSLEDVRKEWIDHIGCGGATLRVK